MAENSHRTEISLFMSEMKTPRAMFAGDTLENPLGASFRAVSLDQLVGDYEPIEGTLIICRSAQLICPAELYPSGQRLALMRP